MPEFEAGKTKTIYSNMLGSPARYANVVEMIADGDGSVTFRFFHRRPIIRREIENDSTGLDNSNEPDTMENALQTSIVISFGGLIAMQSQINNYLKFMAKQDDSDNDHK